MKNRTYSTPNNRYERYLNELRDRTWGCMSKTGWDYALYEFGRIQFGKSAADDDNESVDDTLYSAAADESVDEHVVDESITNEHVVNEPIVDIEFTTKKDLYNYYGIDIKTIPEG